MIDIHTHILPFIDDGSKNIDSSIDLIKESILLGVTDLFLTPHYMKTRQYLSTYPENLEIFNRLLEEVKKQNLKINLHLGNEVYYSLESIKDIREKKVIPLGKSKMILLEFSTKEEEDIAEAIHNIKALGYVPIVAHIERYSYLKDLSDFQGIKKMGALIQVNASSVLGYFGNASKKLIFKLIKLNLVDFIASDIHSFRVNYLKEAYELIQKKFGKEMAIKLFHNTILLT